MLAGEAASLGSLHSLAGGSVSSPGEGSVRRLGRELVALVTFRDSHLPGGNVSIQRKQLFTSSHPQKTLLPTQYLGLHYTVHGAPV